MFFRSKTKELYNDILVPSLFLDMYLPICTGNQLKVYLLGYREALFFNGINNRNIDNKEISKILNISIDEVLEAWIFWERMGVIKIHDKDQKNIIEFIDLKTEYLKSHNNDGISDEDDNINKSNDIDSSIETYSSQNLVNMYENIEAISARPLTPNERLDLLNAIEKYNIDSQLVVHAFESVARETGRIKSIKYIIAILKSWFDNSIKTKEDLMIYEKNRSEKNDIYRVIFSNLGFNRMPTSYEKETIDTWFEDYHMSMEMVMKACSKSINTPNPNIKYLDKIISNWYNSGIRTLEDVEKEDIAYAKKKAEKTQYKANPSKSSSSQKRTKFHNFKPSLTGKYSNEELNNLIKNLNKK
ncbi:DnaD domain-containing protein [Peptostreptococcus equinus]|uniref:DnaD domain protein n=1 Tax=Peptostreptococcus equinus TaxID=3003601 RepID=A0ABY7JNZ4_9FIRM|nr:DnaD domain protein [Peptostreptococcus sp. CBA3647]WAW14884.1 DnaD domain protein [Peptostreptococcus sp. CBA3647]